VLALQPPVPVNDTVCDAINLGVLDFPGSCSSYPYGDTIQVTGTTLGASYNSFDFSPMSCVQGGAPDVWYRFVGTGNYVYIEMQGTTGLDSFFVRLYSSQGTCLSLIPLQCDLTTNGTMQTSLYTPDIGGTYYLQIGGFNWWESGDFSFSIKSYNECAECVKSAELTMSPAPWFGKYGTSDTVEMCVTVDRWQLLTTADLHGIVPVFGSDWDLTTLTPLSAPSTSSNWAWFNGITTPNGTQNGYFFDADGNGNPTDNQGDVGNLQTEWKACWRIASLPYCQNYDLSVNVFLYSEDATGDSSGNVTCVQSPPIYASVAGWCCEPPQTQIVTMVNCSTATVLIDPAESSAIDSFDVVVYDDSMHVAYIFPTSVGTQILTGVFTSGQYLIECYNSTNGCITYRILNVPEGFSLELEQTAIGCGPAMGSAIVNPNPSVGNYTYQWLNIPTTNWIDSLAFGLNMGFAAVTVTNATGCSVTDSVFIMELESPGADFGYADKTYCHNTDTIQVYYQPLTGGGIYNLVAPLASGITVNASTGVISLNNTALVPPYEIKVKYTVGTQCVSSWIDSVQINQQPSAPVPVGNAAIDYCIGSAAPVLQVTGAGIVGWYDFQTTAVGATNTYFTPLNSSTAPGGPYLYVFTAFSDLTFGCASSQTVFAITAYDSPSVIFSNDTVICEGEIATLTALGNSSYQYNWTPAPTSGQSASQNTTTSPASTQTYSCTVTQGACSTTGSVMVTVTPAEDCGFAVYTGITPNGDGFNDHWIIDGAAPDKELSVWIYDRWGALVWSNNNYDNLIVYWSGQGKSGELVPAGTYFYIINQSGENKATGWLELSR
jgi:gliding motility-associated-like protein